MADENATNDEAGAIELRPCSYCGTDIHPSSHRCVTCGGHVGLSWGTVHKELFLFLFASILIGVGCIASWAVRSPTGDADPSNGLRTIRGCVMFALALYGVTSAYFSILNRKMVVWPFLLNALDRPLGGHPGHHGHHGRPGVEGLEQDRRGGRHADGQVVRQHAGRSRRASCS